MENVLAFMHILLASSNSDARSILLLLPLSGVIFYIYQYTRYRNQNKSYQYENKTDIKVSNITGHDNFIRKITGTKRHEVKNCGKSRNPRKRVEPCPDTINNAQHNIA